MIVNQLPPGDGQAQPDRQDEARIVGADEGAEPAQNTRKGRLRGEVLPWCHQDQRSRVRAPASPRRAAALVRAVAAGNLDCPRVSRCAVGVET